MPVTKEQTYNWSSAPDQCGVIAIKNELDWLLLTGGTDKSGFDDVVPIKDMLCIVEVYRSWCGPTMATMPFRRLKMEYVDEKKRLLLLNVCADDMGSYGNLKAYQATCKPHFLVYLNGEKLETVEGVSEWKLMELVAKHLPPGEVVLNDDLSDASTEDDDV